MEVRRKEHRREKLRWLRLVDEPGPVEAPRKEVDDGEHSYVDLIERLVAEELQVRTGPSLIGSDDNGSPPNQRQEGELLLQAHQPPLRERPHGVEQQTGHRRLGRVLGSPCDRHGDTGPRRDSVKSPTRFRLPVLLMVLLAPMCFLSPCVAHAEDDFAKRYQDYREHVKSGEASLKMGDYDSAIGSFTVAIGMSPFEAGNCYSRGIARYKSGKEEEAIEDFNRVIVLKPKMSAALVYRGLCNERLEKFGEALMDYNAGLQISPKDPSIHNNLAWLYLTAKDEKRRDRIRALEHAVKAAAFSEERNAQILDTLARAFFVNGKTGEAAETERKAIRLDPRNEQFKSSLKTYEESIGRRDATGRSSATDNPR